MTRPDLVAAVLWITACVAVGYAGGWFLAFLLVLGAF